MSHVSNEFLNALTKESIVKKTSRLSFGKQMMAALTALLVAIIATAPDATAQTAKQTKPQNQRQADRIVTHDTPPPIEIGDGSLRIDSHEDLGQPTQNGQRFVY